VRNSADSLDPRPGRADRAVAVAFQSSWPQARTLDLLDTSLVVDLARKARLDRSIVDRFVTLGQYACLDGGIGSPLRGILSTCSAFGPAIDEVKMQSPIPIFGRSEALNFGGESGCLSAFCRPAAAFGRNSNGRRLNKVNRSRSSEPLQKALLTPSSPRTRTSTIEPSRRRLPECKAPTLPFWVSFHLPARRSALSCPVITTPDAAVHELRRSVGSVSLRCRSRGC
jgi:hypothetical protein